MNSNRLEGTEAAVQPVNSKRGRLEETDLSVLIAGIELQNPIMPASGCFGFGEEFNQIEGFDLSKLGALVSKGTTLLSREGNKQPRIIEAEGGMINSIGLENPGIEIVIKGKIPFMAKSGVPVIINISGFTVQEFAALAKKLNNVAGVSAIEVNISCPNIHGGNLPFGSTPEAAAEVVRAVRSVGLFKLPLIVKLTPNVPDIVPIALAVEEAGADAISLINTVKREYANGRIGGLSGPPIKKIAMRMVSQVYQAVKVPVIGMGGISTIEDVINFIKLGTTAVAIGTANFFNPLVMMELIDQLEKYCEENQIQNLSQIRGTEKIT